VLNQNWIDGELHSLNGQERVHLPSDPSPQKTQVVTSQPVLWTMMTHTDGDAERSGTDHTSLYSAREGVRRSPQAANKNSSMPLLLPTNDIPPVLYGSMPLFTSTVYEKVR
jgi:hypothetical protein